MRVVDHMPDGATLIGLFGATINSLRLVCRQINWCELRVPHSQRPHRSCRQETATAQSESVGVFMQQFCVLLCRGNADLTFNCA